jgi:hypothetical protein
MDGASVKTNTVYNDDAMDADEENSDVSTVSFF